MTDLVARAAAFAKAAHESIGQCRKYTGAPYIVHPQAVAEIVAEVTDDSVMIAAAWLHDVVEDTPIEIEEIAEVFGTDVARLVNDLTDVARSEDGNRAQRVAINRQHTAQADPRAKTIKLADLIDNLSDILVRDPGYARKYFAEKELLLNVLTGGDSALYQRVCEIIAVGKEQFMD